jgi:5-methylthioadenosine/S-adenosylhomocysteine deaminase
MTTTVFRNCAWVVAWDEARSTHVYRRGIDVAISDTSVAFVGRGYAGPADAEVDASRRLLLPGLVNIHTHPTSEPLRKGITDETRSPGFWHSSLYEFLTVFNNDREGAVAAMRVALAELLMSGVTTVVDISPPFDGWLDTLAESGPWRRRCSATRAGSRATVTGSSTTGTRRRGATVSRMQGG